MRSICLFVHSFLQFKSSPCTVSNIQSLPSPSAHTATYFTGAEIVFGAFNYWWISHQFAGCVDRRISRDRIHQGEGETFFKPCLIVRALDIWCEKLFTLVIVSPSLWANFQQVSPNEGCMVVWSLALLASQQEGSWYKSWLGPFCVVFACSLCVCADSLRVLQLPPTTPKHACQVNWRL